MKIEIKWAGHAAFKINIANKIIYIDPWKLDKNYNDGDFVLVSHSHYDHYSAKDIAAVSKNDTYLIGSADVIAKQGYGHTIRPDKNLILDGVTISAIAAYNPEKEFHPITNEWVGFIIEVDGKKIYYAGDTDITTEMSGLPKIDLALLPVGGTYTMNPHDAAKAVNNFKPKIAIPYHWGDVVGDIADAELFDELADCQVEIINPGQTITLEI